MSFRGARGAVAGPLGPGTLDLPARGAPLRRMAQGRTKFTLTSPYMLAKSLLDRHYGDRHALTLSLAALLREQVRDVDADVIQVDEANPGHPQDGPFAAEAINAVLEGVPEEGAGLHLCFGNYGGQMVQKGHYESLVDFLNRLRVDHVLLEFARRGYAELEYLRQLERGSGWGWGWWTSGPAGGGAGGDRPPAGARRASWARGG